MTSSRVMPMPLSSMVSVRSSSSSLIEMRGLAHLLGHVVLREREEARLVERVGRVGDELAEEDLFVRVERVDDQREDLLHLGLEREFGGGVLGGANFSWDYRERQSTWG